MKTLAIRLDDELHARLSILAKLSGASVVDTIRAALDVHLAKLAEDPEISAKAEALASEIDREAAEQRDALSAMFGASKPTPRARQPKN